MATARPASGPGRADVDQLLAIGRHVAHPDHGAHASRGRRRQRNEVRQRSVDAVARAPRSSGRARGRAGSASAAPSTISPSFDRPDRQAVACTWIAPVIVVVRNVARNSPACSKQPRLARAGASRSAVARSSSSSARLTPRSGLRGAGAGLAERAPARQRVVRQRRRPAVSSSALRLVGQAAGVSTTTRTCASPRAPGAAREALAAQPEQRARLRRRRHPHAHAAVEHRHVDLRAQRRLDRRQRHLDQVSTSPRASTRARRTGAGARAR